jgi:hypothetical protein
MSVYPCTVCVVNVWAKPYETHVYIYMRLSGKEENGSRTIPGNNRTSLSVNSGKATAPTNVRT